MSVKKRALMETAAIYGVVGLIGVLTVEAVDGHPLVRLGAADLAMTLVIFAASIWKSNTSAYDAFWSVIPSYFSVWLWFEFDGANWSWMQWGTMVVLNLWSWRLTHNWARGWPGWHHEDWRYVDFRNQQGPIAFQFTNFFGLHFFPTVIVFAACVGLVDVATASRFNIGLMTAGMALGLFGVWLEWVADNQLAAFRHRADPQPTDILRTGIWGVIRYPNYLGEMLFWWGMALCGLGAGGSWWVILGATGMVFLFALASIPMKERRMRARRPDFEGYRSEVSALIPGVW